MAEIIGRFFHLGVTPAGRSGQNAENTFTVKPTIRGRNLKGTHYKGVPMTA